MTYDTIPSSDVINKTADAVRAGGLEVLVVETKADALALIKTLIPKDASVMNGASVTLEEIGFVDYLKEGKHGWNNLHEAIVKEADPAKQGALRKQALLSEYYLGSVHALSETGEFLIASNTGSQLPHIVYSSTNPIFVVGAQKIVPSLDEAFKRLDKHVVPLEDKRLMGVYNMHTTVNKILVFRGESAFAGRKVRMIIVKEALGF